MPSPTQNRKRWILAMPVVVVLSLGVGATDEDRHDPSRAAEGELLAEFIRIYNLQTFPSLDRFVREQYSEDVLDQTSGGESAIVDRWMRVFSLVGPVSCRYAERDDAGHLRVWTFGERTRSWLAFTFGADEQGKIDEHAIFSTVRPPGLHPTAPALTPDQLAVHMRGYLEGLARADDFSGVVALVRNGEIAWSFAAGYPDAHAQEPFGIASKFDLASVSKMFVAVAAMQLRERGDLPFDAPITDYLPQYPAHVGRNVTVGHLLSHTSGLRLQDDDELYRRLFRARSFEEQFELQTAAVAERYGRDFEPGTDYLYSNEGIDLVARVIEVVSGKSYYEYLRSEIFEPLGMRETHPYNARSDRDVAVGLTRQHPPGAVFVPGPRRGNQFFLYDAGRPAGGMVTTAGDLARFATALLDGTLLSEESWQEMISPRALQQKTTDFRLSYGWGVDVYEYADDVVVGHGGGRPGASTRVDIFPRQRLVLIVLSNYDYIAHRIAEHVQEVLNVGAEWNSACGGAE